MIIGGGPAGLSAAIYSARANYKTLVLDTGKSRLYYADKIQNYFGIPDIGGNELMRIGREQARMFGTEIKNEEALVVRKTGGIFVVETNKDTYSCKGLILATGLPLKKPSIPSLESFIGKGVSYCVLCDGFFFKAKRVGVIGARNHAAKEALELLSHTTDIVLLTNGERPNIDNTLLDKLKEAGVKIDERKINRIFGDSIVRGVVFDDGGEMPLNGIFVALGDAGATEMANMLGLELRGAYIAVDTKQKTNLDCVYAAGDCTGSTSQVAIAVGQGANAAISLISELKNSK